MRALWGHRLFVSSVLEVCTQLHGCPGTHLYSEEASWAAMGTSLAKISGPVTAGSVGLTGRAFTSGAPAVQTQSTCGSRASNRKTALFQSQSLIPSRFHRGGHLSTKPHCSRGFPHLHRSTMHLCACPPLPLAAHRRGHCPSLPFTDCRVSKAGTASW